jgi:hypothetical protein
MPILAATSGAMVFLPVPGVPVIPKTLDNGVHLADNQFWLGATLSFDWKWALNFASLGEITAWQ